jgi:hypothetical protein
MVIQERVPLRLIETTGEDALAKWEELKSVGQGSPVVLGGDNKAGSFDYLLTLSQRGGSYASWPSVEELVRAAAGISFPGDLARHKKSEIEAVIGHEYEPNYPPIGEWPASPNPSMGLSIVHDFRTGRPVPKAYIAVVPTDDWTTIPAYLSWGGWNYCPAPEYHVAALRIWRDRYGAELIGMGRDTINLRVTVKPETREQALALAREQYIYCPDTVDQGVPTYSALAADLMANDWWFFWWD